MHRRKLAALAAVSLGAALALPLTTTSVGAAPAGPEAPRSAASAPSRSTVESTSQGDALTQPWQKRYEAIQQAALEQRLRTGGTGQSERLAKGTYGRVEQTGQDRVFVVLAEFGMTEHSAYPDGDSNSTRVDGPRHNQIPKPKRFKDNSTLWQASYDKAHYQDMYFNRMDNFYRAQSQGKYSIDGETTDWVRVPFNQARYGRDVCGDVVCNNTWFLIRDALSLWTEGKLDAGWSMTRITNYLKTFDKQDRYDFDGDGNFREPDGYIDHMQIVHAGGDQADGDPVYGEDAIWSHRWYAQVEPQGTTGPANGPALGGVEIGSGGVSDAAGSNVSFPDNRTGVWVGDYTIQPENGGLSVFAHEYGHDLGLPDLYDTNGGSNSVEHWSLMAQSRGTAKQDEGIGDRPMPFGAWEKFQLGWLDYDTARAARASTHKLRPAQNTTGADANALIVLLPDKQVDVELGAPCADCGSSYFYSDSGDDLDNTMTLDVEGGGALTATANFEIEDGWDYAFLEASTDDGETFTPVPTSIGYDGEDQSGLDPTDTGISGTTDGAWVDLTATVPADATQVRFRYLTDGAFALRGFSVDNIAIDGTAIGTAETEEGWSLEGFRTTTGTESESNLNAYFVDNRQIKGRDTTLGHIYNFGYTGKFEDKVKFFAYEPGALISYWDTSYSDNNTSLHPGGGQILPVDARPRFSHSQNGDLVRPKVLTYDSTFGLTRSKTLNLVNGNKPYTVRGQAAVPVFDDSVSYWFDNDEHGTGEHSGLYSPGEYSVDVPDTNTKIRVVKVDKNGIMTLRVSRG